MTRTSRLAALLVLVLSGCVYTRPPDSMRPNPVFHGTWAGTASQYDSGEATGVPDSQWDVVATIGDESRVTYPTLDCSGTLEYVTKDDTSVTFTETITSGMDRCVSTGTIRFTRDGSTLIYQASHESQPSISVARLTRR